MRNSRFAFAVFLVAAFLSGAARGENIVTVPASACVWHAGDNPAWAAARLDESGWKPLDSWKVVADQSLMWMRCRADLATLRQTTHPALEVNAARAYQVFLNGKLVGQNGEMGNGQVTVNPLHTFPVTAGDLAVGTDTVALRLRVRAVADVRSGFNPPEIMAGEAGWLRDRRNSEALAGAVGFLPVAVGYLVIGVMGFVLLGLYLNDRRHLELLLLAMVCWLLAIVRLCDFSLAAMAPIPGWLWWGAEGAGQLMIFPEVWFMFWLAHRRVPVLYKILLAVGLSFVLLHMSNAFFPVRASLRLDAVSWRWGWVLLADGAILMAAPFVAFWPWHRVPKGMRAMAGCAMLWGLMDVVWFSAWEWVEVSPAENAFFAQWEPKLLELRMFGTIAAIIALIGLLFREQRRTAAERAMLAGEMQAARQIQQMLAPEHVETAAGVRVEVAFRPMREVGGDFYLCRALPDGRQRVLVGDVSGKGAAAAMTATLLIGAAERRDEDSPAALLAHLNLVLHGSRVGGFATCLCADLTADGTVTLGNAGHLHPYLAGEEVEVTPSLPLGVSATDAVYAEQRVHLAKGQTLTFISDGVVEAQNATGELFGFERTGAIANGDAETIAAAAEAFGQNDDITVLTLRRETLSGTVGECEPVLAPAGQ